MGGQLGLRGGLVTLAEKEPRDAILHREAACAVAVAGATIPRKVNPCKFFALPILAHLAVFVEDVEEVPCMALADMLDTKIVHNEDKLDGAPLVSPQPWCCGGFEVPGGVEAFAQEVVGQLA